MPEELAANLRLAGSQPSAFGAVYQDQAPLLFAFFARRTFDIDVSSDLTAETLAQAFEHRRKFRGSTDGEARGWLFGIAQHQFSRYVRRGTVERDALTRLGIRLPELGADDYERMVDLAGLAETRERVRLAFGTLPAEQHAALRLRVIDERSYPDVAAALGVSEQAARARVSRALRALASAAEIATTSEVRP
jgi:RNA polymerase sigma-70 factor, ECF subfamily